MVYGLISGEGLKQLHDIVFPKWVISKKIISLSFFIQYIVYTIPLNEIKVV